MKYGLCMFESRYARIEGLAVPISIDDAIANKYPEANKYYCVPCHHELLAVKNCKKIQPHFRHKNKGDYSEARLSEWHKQWQLHFPFIEVATFSDKVGQYKNRRADIHLPEFNRVIEIQHSKIELGEVDMREHDYRLHKQTVTWIIDGQDCIEVKKIGERTVLHFLSCYWLYESFLNCKEVYYDIGGIVYKAHPLQVKSHQTDVATPISKGMFIKALKENIDPWNGIPNQCYLSIIQMGAGSGKTYGLMQALNNSIEFAAYRTIVFITKQHSAVNVLYTTFNEQYRRDLLTNIHLVEEPVREGKKLIIKYKHKLTGVTAHAIFATVDAFTFAIGTTTQYAYDKFLDIVISIASGTIKADRAGKIDFTSCKPKINKEMLIVVDEAQDLSKVYGEALLQIVEARATNVCVVGDGMQSLVYEENALTYLQSVQKPLMQVIAQEKSNKVRRFTSPNLIQFVNNMIPFNQFGYNEMSVHEDNESIYPTDSLKIVQMPKNDKRKRCDKPYLTVTKTIEHMTSHVELVMECFEKEVTGHQRVPEDFLIVTPFTKNNFLVETLQMAITSFWKTKMEDQAYSQEVKSKHDYWKYVDTSMYTTYAVFHKSEEGTSINLEESKHATRIVSIHTSKGDGRNVVFVVGLTQSALQKFSGVTDCLTYYSLLHVAITRQKEILYFFLTPNLDEIHQRVLQSGLDIDICKDDLEFDFPKNISRLRQILDYIDVQDYNSIIENAFSYASLDTLCTCWKEKQIIDMRYHNMRYSAMFMNIYIHFCNTMINGKMVKKQFIKILEEIVEVGIEDVYCWQDYTTVLRRNINENYQDFKKIPILKFRNDSMDYKRYGDIIKNYTKFIADKFRKSLKNSRFEYLCPYESIILFYMIECVQNGCFQTINIGDLYNVTHIYKKHFSETIEGHEHCNCKQQFLGKETLNSEVGTFTESYNKYIHGHFEGLTSLKNNLTSLDTEHPNTSWLYHHPVYYDGDNESFKLWTKFSMIGYTPTTVIAIYVKPQLNEINYVHHLIETLFDTFLLLNVDEKSNNRKRFEGKKILCKIFSLESDQVYTVDWTDIVRGNMAFFRDNILKALMKRFESKHAQYHKTFVAIVQRNKCKVKRVVRKLQNHIDNSVKDAPKYVLDSLTYISSRLEEASCKVERMKTLSRFMKEDCFNQIFKTNLERSLARYFGIEQDDTDSGMESEDDQEDGMPVDSNWLLGV
jgi:AAA domain